MEARDDKALIETRISGGTAYQGPFLQVEHDTVRLPDGKQTAREYIVHPGAVMILPLLDEQHVLIERQFRYPMRRVMLEFPAGKLDEGESALACGQRELEEETGYRASEWHFLTRIHPVISYSTEAIDLYLARGLTAGQQRLDEGEFVETEIMPIARLLDGVKRGEISDVKTIIGAFWLEKLLAGDWPYDTVSPQALGTP